MADQPAKTGVKKPTRKQLEDENESLRIQLKHLRNDYDLTRRENEEANRRYLETLKNQEDLIRKRTSELEDSRRSLERKSRELQIMLDSSPSMAFIVDRGDSLVRGNRAFLNFLGVEITEAAGRPLRELLPQLDTTFTGRCHSVIESRQPLHGQIETFRMGDEIRRLEIDTLPFAIEKDWTVGVICFAVDRTEQIRYQQEREELERQLRLTQKLEAVGTLAGGIAHDFNNILTIILGYADLATKEAAEGSLLENQLREIQTAGTRAKDLIRQILTFSRQSEQTRKPVQISHLFNEISKMLRASLPSTIQIKTNINSRRMVNADPAQIHQIIMNLCTNAFHAMEDTGGILRLVLTDLNWDQLDENTRGQLDEGEYVLLRVEDTGPGIPADIQHRIFEPYFTTKPQGKGTGLGLSIVHGIVKTYKGAILVDSRRGKGTVFEVFLPSMENRPVISDFSSEPVTVTSGARVLFVDDEEQVVRMSTQGLERYGYEVTGKSSSIEALEVFVRHPERFDIVITDMNMPFMNGTILARKLMQVRPDLPVILCTGFSENLYLEKIQRMGIRDLVMKPVIARQLARKIEALLGKTTENGEREPTS